MREGVNYGMLNNFSIGSKLSLSVSIFKASFNQPGSICGFILVSVPWID